MANDTIDSLNKIIETCKDGEYGFRTSADYANSPDLKQFFARRAQECGEAAAELQTVVMQLGGTAGDSGTLAGAAHRGWVAVKGTLAGYSDLAILEEVERGEDSAARSYREVLETRLPTEVHAVVSRQYQGMQRNHAEVRQLRDEARAAVKG